MPGVDLALWTLLHNKRLQTTEPGPRRQRSGVGVEEQLDRPCPGPHWLLVMAGTVLGPTAGARQRTGLRIRAGRVCRTPRAVSGGRPVLAGSPWGHGNFCL